jgi:hypothetical protein
MPDQKLLPDELMNPYAPPRTDPHQERPTPAESSIRDYTSRIFVLRMLKMLHFVFALVSTVGANFFRAEGVRYGTIVKFGSASVCIVLGALSLGVGLGIWRLRRWAGQLALMQVFCLLVLGSSTGCINSSHRLSRQASRRWCSASSCSPWPDSLVRGGA